MPIKDWGKYPSNWKEIRQRILTRSKHRCEFCGVENYSRHPITGSKVVLTIAHLDHNTGNNADVNLRALCQKCHLNYDKKLHIFHAQETKRKKKLEREKLQLVLTF